MERNDGGRGAYAPAGPEIEVSRLEAVLPPPDDLDEESRQRLQRRRAWRARRQRIVLVVLVAVLVVGVAVAAAVWTGRWRVGPEPVAAVPACAPIAEQALLPPGEVDVQVLNGTDRAGLAATVADELGARGFTVTRVGNAPVAAGPVTATVLYREDAFARARAVAARLPQARLVEDPEVATVRVVLGSAYEGLLAEEALAPPPVPSAGPGC